MAKIKQRADGRYMISVYLGKDSSGKELRKAVYGKTQKEAKEKAEQIRGCMARGLTSPRKGIHLRTGTKYGCPGKAAEPVRWRPIRRVLPSCSRR